MVVYKKHTGICAVLISFLLVGCSLLGGSSKEEPFDLYLVLDKMVYRPNEPVLATLRLQNLNENEINVYNLDARSVEFYHLNETTGEPMEVMPVFSEREPMLTVTKLEPHGNMERSFLFTTITRREGDYSLQALFESSPFGEQERPTVISEARLFRVTGEPPYDRDNKGILKEKDAINIAVERVDLPIVDRTAKLVKNEAGFLDWWVRLTLEDKGQNGKLVQKAYFINPYLAVVRTEADPRIPPPEKKGKEPPVKFKPRDKMTERPKPRPIVPQIGEKKN